MKKTTKAPAPEIADKPTNVLTGLPVDDSVLKGIAEQAALLVQLETTIKNMEEELENIKERHRQLQMDILPSSMKDIGLENFKLKDGPSLILNPFYAASISDENKEAAFAWLKKTKNDEIIKTKIELSFGKGEIARAREVARDLQKKKVPYNFGQSIHHATLKSFVKERIEKGLDIPYELFGVFVGSKVIVK